METNDGPTQEAIDFINQMNDDQLLEEYRFIHEESEKINEHGLGISQIMISHSIREYTFSSRIRYERFTSGIEYLISMFVPFSYSIFIRNKNVYQKM